MPKPVRAFACSWGCCRKVTTHKGDMVLHETRCNKNPLRKACPTCAHDDADTEEDYIGHQFGEAAYSKTYLVRWCHIEKRDKDVNIVYDCDFWEPRQLEGEDETQANKVDHPVAV